jgi:ABC-type oligopeptide transport system substrate-binding subunit
MRGRYVESLVRLLLMSVAFASIEFSSTADAAHAIALYGEPKYAEDFQQFDYADPAAPKGGTLRLSTSYEATSFDKLNPYTLRGKAAPGLIELAFETLAVYSMDETTTQYGLIADDIAVAPDLRAVTFHVHPAARFSNGDRITAADVKYSFDMLTGKGAAPRFRLYFADIERAVIVDSATVRFEFNRASHELAFVAGTLPVFSPRWGVGKEFADVQTDAPIASGPYVVEHADYGRGGVTYRRNPDYWAANLPVRRGAYNFDRVVYKLFRDYDLQVEAFKAGEFDVMVEGKARNWCCVYTGGRFASGELTKQLFPHTNVPGMNGYIFNLRRERFQDVRVRQALALALDFQWINKNIFYGEYRHPYSYFSNSDLAASGLPSAEELKLLEAWRDQLDPAVFGPMVVQASTAPPASLRDNLIKGQRLLAEAGWTYRDGALRNAKGEPFVLEASLSEGIPLPRIETYLRNLARYGIVVKRKLGDQVAARKSMQTFDYDMAMISFRESRIPGSDLRAKLNSADADVPGSENIIGVKSPVVDALIERLATANSADELKTAARALDRVLMHSYYVVPERYSFEHRLAYNTHLGYAQQLPDYYAPYDWVLSHWWRKPDSPPQEKIHVSSSK